MTGGAWYTRTAYAVNFSSLICERTFLKELHYGWHICFEFIAYLQLFLILLRYPILVWAHYSVLLECLYACTLVFIEIWHPGHPLLRISLSVLREITPTISCVASLVFLQNVDMIAPSPNLIHFSFILCNDRQVLMDWRCCLLFFLSLLMMSCVWNLARLQKYIHSSDVFRFNSK